MIHTRLQDIEIKIMHLITQQTTNNKQKKRMLRGEMLKQNLSIEDLKFCNNIRTTMEIKYLDEMCDINRKNIVPYVWECKTQESKEKR